MKKLRVSFATREVRRFRPHSITMVRRDAKGSQHPSPGVLAPTDDERVHDKTASDASPPAAATPAEAASSTSTTASDEPIVCPICEEEKANLVTPYPCRHQLCQDCLLQCQAQEMYRCPFCRVKQTTAVPSNEYKLLKLLVGIDDPAASKKLFDGVNGILQGKEFKNEVIDECAKYMVDFRSQHLEAPVCLKLIDGLLKGRLTREQVKIILTTESVAKGLREIQRIELQRGQRATAAAAASTAAVEEALRDAQQQAVPAPPAFNNQRRAAVMLHDATWVRAHYWRDPGFDWHDPEQIEIRRTTMRMTLYILVSFFFKVVLFLYVSAFWWEFVLRRGRR